MALSTRLGALRRLDWSLFIATVLLVIIGLAALYSVTINVENPDYSRVLRQVIFAGIGIVALFAFALIDYRVWWSTSWALYLLGAGLLAAVLLFGETIRGTTGWFTILGQTFQPVELIRIIFILHLSRFFAHRSDGQNPIRTLVESGLLVAVYVVLLILQPEFGYTALLLGVWLVFVLLARIPRRYLVLLGIGAVLAGAFIWLFVLQGYQKDRLQTFFNPSSDRLGRSYNVTQSIVAIGSGRWFGRGLGLGPQSQLNFLPEQSTDFIFAVIAEELGFLGAVLVISIFSVVFIRLFRAVGRSTDSYSALLLTGILLLVFGQMFINIGMNLGLLPVTGIPLPFISYGGSALLTNCVMIGIAQSVIMRQPKS